MIAMSMIHTGMSTMARLMTACGITMLTPLLGNGSGLRTPTGSAQTL